MGLTSIKKYNLNTSIIKRLYHSKIPRIERSHTEVGTAGNYVQEYLTPCDSVVIKLVKQLNYRLDLIKKYILTFDYIEDKMSINREELWQFPRETIEMKRGDCEDLSILLVTLLLSIGIDAHIILGAVRDKFDLSWAGHAWGEYFDKNTCEWKYIDATNKENNLKFESDTFMVNGIFTPRGFYENLDINKNFKNSRFSTKFLREIKNIIYSHLKKYKLVIIAS